MNTALKTTAKSAQTIALITGVLAALSFTSAGSAEAKTVVKPLVNGYSMYYNKKAKAKDSAVYRWGLEAAEKYGAEFAHWGKAKSKHMKCQLMPLPNKPNKEAWRCRASGKPTREVKICKADKVKAKGMFYYKKADAKDSAVYRWGLKASSLHGADYALWGKATSKKFSCSKGAKDLWNCTAKAKACS